MSQSTKRNVTLTAALSLLLLLCTILMVGVHAQNIPSASIDPCFSNTVKIQGNQVFTTATTLSLIPLVANQTIYVCGMTLVMSGTTTADTLQFVSGTGANCATGQANIGPLYNSGVLTSGATVIVAGYGSNQVFQVANPGRALCATTTVATGPNILVQVSVVQQ